MSVKKTIGATADEKFALLIKSKKMLRDLEEKIEADLAKGRGKFSLRTLEALTKAKQVQFENFADTVLGPLLPEQKPVELPVKIWKTITVGGSSTSDLKNLIKKDFRLGDNANFMMDQPDFQNPQIGEEVSFAMGTLRDFGFTGNTFKEWQDFLAAHPLYEMCLSGDGPYLRTNYTNQPKGQWVRCAMKTISDRDGNPYVFNLEHYVDGMWLDSGWYGPSDGVNLGLLWVVRIRKGILVS